VEVPLIRDPDLLRPRMQREGITSWKIKNFSLAVLEISKDSPSYF
jgi:hypothetical protein